MKHSIFSKTFTFFLLLMVAYPSVADENQRRVFDPKLLDNSTIPVASTLEKEAASVARIATVIPQNNEFSFQFSDEKLSRSYLQYTSQQTDRDKRVSKEEFKEFIQKEALSKLRTLFPDGVPSGAASKIKISVTIKFKPLEIGASIEF